MSRWTSAILAAKIAVKPPMEGQVPKRSYICKKHGRVAKPEVRVV